MQGDQYVGPTPLRLTWPLNRAPTAGPVAPCVHRASKVSGENSPIRVTSLTRSQTFSGAAAIVSVTSRLSPLMPAPHFEYPNKRAARSVSTSVEPPPIGSSRTSR